MFKNEKLYLALPPVSGSKALPVVFSQPEIKLILKTPRLLKHRVLFAVIYDCGATYLRGNQPENKRY
jgi:hypothetical protein